MAQPCPFEQFPSLAAVPDLRHAFLLRAPGVDVTVDKALALERLNAPHLAARRELGLTPLPFVTAEQTHGNGICVVTAENLAEVSAGPVPNVDGLVTDLEGVLLGIYVADCGPVFLVDPIRKAIGLVHSGKKGTELEITTHAIQLMTARYGTDPQDLILQLGPCIRPPAYEIDFAADILHQAEAAGVPREQIHDPGTCTTSDPERYYSYRQEKGKTGRMLALLAWDA